MTNKKTIKDAVTDVLSGHSISQSGIDIDLREMSRGELINTFLSKSSDPEYVKKISELNEEFLTNRDFVLSALDTKERYFERKFEELDDAVSSVPELRQDFMLDLSKFGNEISSELAYNEYQRQLRNYADQELETPNKLLREKIRSLDPHYSFKSIQNLSWADQNIKLQEAYQDLQEGILSAHESVFNNYDELTTLISRTERRGELRAILDRVDHDDFRKLWFDSSQFTEMAKKADVFGEFRKKIKYAYSSNELQIPSKRAGPYRVTDTGIGKDEYIFSYSQKITDEVNQYTHEEFNEFWYKDNMRRLYLGPVFRQEDGAVYRGEMHDGILSGIDAETYKDGSFQDSLAHVRTRILSLDPNFPLKKFEGLPAGLQKSVLEQKIPEIEKSIQNMKFYQERTAELDRKGIYGTIYDNMSFSQVFRERLWAQHVAKLEGRLAAMTEIQRNLDRLSNEEFNAMWTGTIKDQTGQELGSEFATNFRRLFNKNSTDDVYNIEGIYYRNIRDDQLIDEAVTRRAETFKIEEEQRLAAQFISAEKQARLDLLRREREREEAAAAAEKAKTVESETIADKITYIDPSGKRHDFNETDLENLDPAIQKRVKAQQDLRQKIDRYNSNKYVSKQVEEQMTNYKPPQIDREQSQETLTSQIQSGTTPPVSESVNQVTKDTVQQKAIGETESTRIEREAVEKTYNLRKQINSSLLLNDTARSYTFGYKQKALLGFMGTAGVVSLLEAGTSGPNQEAIERRRRLEEERRKKQFGY